MGRCALASADVVRLPLEGGDFVIVKKELNAGEAIDLADEPGNRILPAVLAYLVGWSLVGFDDQPIPYSPTLPLEERRDTVRALKASRFEAITDVLVPHIAASRRGIEEKKTTPLVEVAS